MAWPFGSYFRFNVKNHLPSALGPKKIYQHFIDSLTFPGWLFWDRPMLTDLEEKCSFMSFQMSKMICIYIT